MDSFKKIYLSILILAVGGLLVAQYNTPAVEQLLNDSVEGVAYQSNGNMIVVGKFNGHIARINENNEVDDSFAQSTASGLFNDEVSVVVVDDADDIMAGGKFTNFDQSIVGYLIKLKANGEVDQDFLRNMGSGFDDQVNSIVLQSDGKFIIGGNFQHYNGQSVSHIARVNKDGSLDKNFKIGSGFDKPVLSISLSHAGEIKVGGQFTQFNGQSSPYFALLNSSGALQ
ncbi:MAG: delta-60 repeat domain-containing protein [Bdellovibrionales bacterium]|nr:delta-60 repeat domain-containing protein [Bdellovibrionales bacterium]